MPQNGFFTLPFRTLHVPMILFSSVLFSAEAGLSQQSGRLAPPAPLGSSNVVAGPVANPFGQPPMAIGPAPSPAPFAPLAYDAFGRPLIPPPAFPVAANPGNPYWVRRPTPFDGSPPIGGGPVELRSSAGAPGSLPAVSMPAPIGNLRLTVSEQFLNRLIARDEQKPGDIRDFILGAQVSGRQTTATSLRLDLLPCADKTRGVLVLNGTTQSQTTGVTPQATVDVASQQQFVAAKEIFFDGTSFSTRHATVNVQARNQTLGAMTPLTGTIFGGIADRIAYREAERRQPQAEAIAREKVAQRVYPEFDSQIDKHLATANDQLDGTVRRMLRTAQLLPSQQQLSSTDSAMRYCAQIATDLPVSSISALECQLGKDDGACLMLHDTFLNALVAHSGLKGLKVTDKQLQSYLAPYEVKPSADELEKAQPPIQLPGLTNVTTDIEFDENDPLTIQIEQDRTLVTMRASFKPAGQTMLPPLAVRIEYKTELVGDKIIVTPSKARVSVVNDDDKGAVPDIALKMMSQAIESSLTKLAFDRCLPSNLWSFGGAAPRVMGIRTQDGWAAISID